MTEVASAATLESLLMSRSLSDPDLMAASGAAADTPILPDVSVLKIGGQSLMDRGRAAVFPVVEELVDPAGQFVAESLLLVIRKRRAHS